MDDEDDDVKCKFFIPVLPVILLKENKMKRRDKIINTVGIIACVLGCITSLVCKNYIACVLWVLLLLQDLREWKLEETMSLQKDLIDNQDKIIESQAAIIQAQELMIKENEEHNN